MKAEQLKSVFYTNAATSDVIDEQAYYSLVTTLLLSGLCFGKAEPVAAYLLRPVVLVDEKSGLTSAISPPPPQYVVMDIKEWTNEYARLLAMQEIMVQHARQIIGDKDINEPTFKGPGIWSTKKKDFDFDYVRREGTDDMGRLLNIYDPNPEARRIALQTVQPVLIPTLWGEPFLVSAGCSIVIRERDVEGLSRALDDVKRGSATIREALYNSEKGPHHSRFDVYGTGTPDFMEKNYRVVPEKDSTARARSVLSPT